jgi:hypothetical protein
MNLADEAALVAEFRRAIETALESGMTESDIAHFFGASKVTVRRWKSGENHPHPAIMKVMPAQLLEEAAKKKKADGNRCWFHSRAYGGRCEEAAGHEGLCYSLGDGFAGGWDPREQSDPLAGPSKGKS